MKMLKRLLRAVMPVAGLWLAMIGLLSWGYGMTTDGVAQLTALYLCAWGGLFAFRRQGRSERRGARLAWGLAGTALSGALWFGLLLEMGAAGMLDETGALAFSAAFWTAWGVLLAIRRARRLRREKAAGGADAAGDHRRDGARERLSGGDGAARRPDEAIAGGRRSRRLGGVRPARRVAALCAAGVLAVVLLVAAGRRAARPVEIPEALQAFAEKYPEAAGFVNDYPAHYRDHLSKDVSGEVKKGVVPLFIQWDERWGYEDYGGNYFAVNGCGPTCLSMVVCGLTGRTDTNPYAVACYSQEQGYYTPGSGTSWSLMTQGAAHYGLDATRVTVSAEAITDALAQEYVMIASMKPGDFTYTGHFIVLTGLDKDGLVRVNDSNSRVNSAKSWDAQVLADQMKGAWRYSYDG